MNCTNETRGHVALNAIATSADAVGAYKVKVPGLRKATKPPPRKEVVRNFWRSTLVEATQDGRVNWHQAER